MTRSKKYAVGEVRYDGLHHVRFFSSLKEARKELKKLEPCGLVNYKILVWNEQEELVPMK